MAGTLIQLNRLFVGLLSFGRSLQTFSFVMFGYEVNAHGHIWHTEPGMQLVGEHSSLESSRRPSTVSGSAVLGVFLHEAL